ncbi:SIR2 family protein [Streptococcus uberis]|uniref:SIR2 family protein n=1 Tax=Streptococcus uberis TaxID=1349 RepID=UPI001939857B|nr:SIR2 family protein [Streptococcus uberis]
MKKIGLSVRDTMVQNFDLAIERLIEAKNTDSLLVFVGAGVSANSGLPTWSKLINLLTKGVETSFSNDYLKLAELYYQRVGKVDYQKSIQELFSGNFQPNELHLLLEKLKPSNIVTTNFDCLIENQFSKSPLNYDVIAKDSDIPKSKPRHLIIKMHGDLKNENFVLKESDYKSYKNNFKNIKNLVNSLIMTHTLLFIGYSLNDETLNNILYDILDSFKEEAKDIYLFTSQEYLPADIQYYKERGVSLLSLDSGLEKRDKFIELKNFLELLVNSDDEEISSSEELWKQISFLDKMYFVESSDIAKYSKLKRKAINRYKGYDWFHSSDDNFSTKLNSNLTKFINSKSNLEFFFDSKIDEIKQYNPNSKLSYAYSLYKDRQYSLAKKTFRKIANECYKEKDYLNYLIAEYNFTHIIENIFDNKVEYESPIFEGEIEKKIDELINETYGDNKKILIYFKETIFNFRFAYRKLESINNYFDKFRDENYNYRKGGSSYNNNLDNLYFEIENYHHFLTLNCICIDQYSIHSSIINRWFEILILCQENSVVKNTSILGETSSIIYEIDRPEIELILPVLKIKEVPIILEKLSIKKIKLSLEAQNHIFKTIEKYNTSQVSRINSNYNTYRNGIKFLQYIDPHSIAPIIAIFSSVIFNFEMYEEVRVLINILEDKIEKLNEEDQIKIFKIVEKQINFIIDNKYELHYRNFTNYKQVIQQITNKVDCKLKLKFLDELKDISNKSEEEIVRILEQPYYKAFENFYTFVDANAQMKIIQILSKYSNLSLDKIDLAVVIKLIVSEVFEFKNLQDIIYKNLTESIMSKEMTSIRSFPSSKNIAISEFYNLYRKDYFGNIVLTEQFLNQIGGIYPQVDWVILKKRDKFTVDGLVKNSNFKIAKEVFAKNDEDKKVFDNWAIQMFDNGEVIRN